jgi:hypothetical protein
LQVVANPDRKKWVETNPDLEKKARRKSFLHPEGQADLDRKNRKNPIGKNEDDLAPRSLTSSRPGRTRASPSFEGVGSGLGVARRSLSRVERAAPPCARVGLVLEWDVEALSGLGICGGVVQVGCGRLEEKSWTRSLTTSVKMWGGKLSIDPYGLIFSLSFL